MTIWGLLALWRRRWIITSLCLVVGVVGVAQARSVTTVYWGSVSVVIMPPYLKNHLAPLGGDAIPLAGVLEKLVTAGRYAPPAVNPDVSIVDRGVLDGVVADVPDYGGQWAENYTNPMIVVQASASDPQTVADRISAEVARIDQTLITIQDEARVAKSARATTLALPPTASVSRASGLSNRAFIAAVALMCLSLIAVPYGCDWLLRQLRGAAKIGGATN